MSVQIDLILVKLGNHALFLFEAFIAHLKKYECTKLEEIQFNDSAKENFARALHTHAPEFTLNLAIVAKMYAKILRGTVEQIYEHDVFDFVYKIFYVYNLYNNNNPNAERARAIHVIRNEFKSFILGYVRLPSAKFRFDPERDPGSSKKGPMEVFLGRKAR